MKKPFDDIAKLKSDVRDCIIDLIDAGYKTFYNTGTAFTQIGIGKFNNYYVGAEAVEGMRKLIEHVKEDYNLYSNDTAIPNISFHYRIGGYKYTIIAIDDFLNNKLPDNWDKIKDTCFSLSFSVYK